MRAVSMLSILVALAFACSSPEPPSETSKALGSEVAVTGGSIYGVGAGNGIRAFHGVPYAAPPVGELRWAPPQPVVAWEGLLDTGSPGPACPQIAGPPGGFYSSELGELSEDCLTLNVWTGARETDEKRPVMVWVHGGSLTSGAGSDYPGDLLASKGIVLVTVNYRLGVFGFLAHPELSAENPNGVSGNQGLRDQVAALAWVRDNIGSFGGDADNVTIFGESAGSLSMSLLQATPSARGLFHRVIGQSGGAFQPMTLRDQATPYAGSAEDLGARFGEALVAEGTEATLTNMRAESRNRVLATFASDPAFSNYDSLAIVDGEVIPREVAAIFAAGEQSDVPVMIGSNADEGTTFLSYFEPVFGRGVEGFRNYTAATFGEVGEEFWAAYPMADDDEAWRSWVDLFSDALFAYPMRTWARSMENVSSPAYLYWFTWSPPVADQLKYQAFHAGEIGYVFGNLDLFGATPTEADYAFSDKLSDVWVRFAQSGDPNGGNLPNWPAYTRANEAYMELGAAIEAGTMLRMDQMALIEEAWEKRREAAMSTGTASR